MLAYNSREEFPKYYKFHKAYFLFCLRRNSVGIDHDGIGSSLDSYEGCNIIEDHTVGRKSSLFLGNTFKFVA